MSRNSNRRKILKVVAGGSVAGSMVAWKKPIVDAVLLPAHAITTEYIPPPGNPPPIDECGDITVFAEKWRGNSYESTLIEGGKCGDNFDQRNHLANYHKVYIYALGASGDAGKSLSAEWHHCPCDFDHGNSNQKNPGATILEKDSGCSTAAIRAQIQGNSVHELRVYIGSGLVAQFYVSSGSAKPGGQHDQTCFN